MSIADNYIPVVEQGNGVTLIFTGAWNPVRVSYLRVFLEDIATGVQTLQVLGLDYSAATLSTGGFRVTFLLAAPSALYNVVITRFTTQDQDVPYRTSKGFDGANIEGSFDKLTAMVQELQDETNRALKFPLGSTSIGQIVGVPADQTVLMFTGTGGDVTTGPSLATILGAAAAATTAINAATASATSAALSQSWAIDPIGLRPEGSAKYWAGQASIMSNEFSDNLFRVIGSGDATKKLAFEVDGFTTGTTRTVTVPNKSGTLAMTSDIAFGTNPAALAGGNGSATTHISVAQAGGRLIQQVSSYVGTLLIFTGLIPTDNTIPQISEGAQILSVNFTPLRADSILVANFSGYIGASGNSGVYQAVALFDTGASATDAVRAGAAGAGSASTQAIPHSLSYQAITGSTTARTISVRAGGANVSQTLGLNNVIGAQWSGGAGSGVLTVYEYAPLSPTV